MQNILLHAWVLLLSFFHQQIYYFLVGINSAVFKFRMAFVVINLLLFLSMLLLRSGLICVPLQSSVTHRISYESWLASRGLMLSPFHVRWQTTMFNRLFAHCARINPRALFLWCGALLISNNLLVSFLPPCFCLNFSCTIRSSLLYLLLL